MPSLTERGIVPEPTPRPTDEERAVARFGGKLEFDPRDYLTSSERDLLVRAVASRVDTDDEKKAAEALAADGSLGPLASVLLLRRKPDPYVVQAANSILSRSVRNGGLYGGGYSRPGVDEEFDTYGVKVPEHLAETPIVCVGDGPAGRMAASTAKKLGFNNVTIVTNRMTRPFGIWGQPNVVGEGYNNPGALSTDDAHLPITPEQEGSTMRTFLDEVSANLTPDNFKFGRVTGIKPGDRTHTVHLQHGGEEETLEAPIVLVCTGNAEPRPLQGGHMDTNARSRDVNYRWQHQMDRAEAERLSGTNVVIVGLGNSARTQLTQIEAWNETLAAEGKDPIVPTVLTHYPTSKVRRPLEPFTDDNGQTKSVGRGIVDGNYVRFEVDRPGSRAVYEKMLNNGRIWSDGARWDVAYSETGAKSVTFTTEDGEQFTIDNVGQLNVLTGFGNNTEQMQRFGFPIIDTYYGYPDIHSFDGQMRRFDGKGRGIMALGVAGVTPENPSARVIPGIMNMVPEAMFSAVIQAEKHAQITAVPAVITRNRDVETYREPAEQAETTYQRFPNDVLNFLEATHANNQRQSRLDGERSKGYGGRYDYKRHRTIWTDPRTGRPTASLELYALDQGRGSGSYHEYQYDDEGKISGWLGLRLSDWRIYDPSFSRDYEDTHMFRARRIKSGIGEMYAVTPYGLPLQGGGIRLSELDQLPQGKELTDVCHWGKLYIPKVVGPSRLEPQLGTTFRPSPTIDDAYSPRLINDGAGIFYTNCQVDVLHNRSINTPAFFAKLEQLGYDLSQIGRTNPRHSGQPELVFPIEPAQFTR